MNKLQKFGAGFFVLLLLMLWGIAGHSVSCQAGHVIHISSSVVNPTKVKITFDKEKEMTIIDQIRLFRRDKAVNGKWKKIATLKGSVKSYKDTVKFNTIYDYKAVAYHKCGKKYIKLDSHNCSGGATVLPVWWDGFSDGKDTHPVTTQESVSITAEVYHPDADGLFPDGYEIYKSTDNKNFECIKVINGVSVWDLMYVDTDVQRGQTYYYKLRGFFKYNKKKYYSPFSHTEVCKIP